jgi:hypothetical protein
MNGIMATIEPRAGLRAASLRSSGNRFGDLVPTAVRNLTGSRP